MQIRDDEDSLGRAEVDDPLEPLETSLEPDSRRIVGLEVPVVEGHTDAVEPELRETNGPVSSKREREEKLKARHERTEAKNFASDAVKKFSRNLRRGESTKARVRVHGLSENGTGGRRRRKRLAR